MMSKQQSIIKGYDATCREYAAQFLSELDKKPLDRLLLRRFAEENADKGIMLDLACGPGQTTQYVRQAGARELLGLDPSPGMIQVAREISRGEIDFEVGDMLKLSFEDEHFASAICFYGIVHFTYEELSQALTEIHRVLKTKAQFLFSFHIGRQIRQVEEFLGKPVSLDFYFFEVEKVLKILEEGGWKLLEAVERYPYEEVEYPSKRAYILVEKKS